MSIESLRTVTPDSRLLPWRRRGIVRPVFLVTVALRPSVAFGTFVGIGALVVVGPLVDIGILARLPVRILVNVRALLGVLLMRCLVAIGLVVIEIASRANGVGSRADHLAQEPGRLAVHRAGAGRTWLLRRQQGRRRQQDCPDRKQCTKHPAPPDDKDFPSRVKMASGPTW